MKQIQFTCNECNKDMGVAVLSEMKFNPLDLSILCNECYETMKNRLENLQWERE